jgi:hypothetical protein
MHQVAIQLSNFQIQENTLSNLGGTWESDQSLFSLLLQIESRHARSFEAIRLSGGLSHPTVAPVIASSGLELIKHVWDCARSYRKAI